MISKTTPQFWQHYSNLPGEVKLLADKTWMTVFPETGPLLSSPLIADGKAYLTASCGITRRYGSLYCVDLETHKVLWTFTDQKKMFPCVSIAV